VEETAATIIRLLHDRDETGGDAQQAGSDDE
jgi:hypothetical protein